MLNVQVRYPVIDMKRQSEVMRYFEIRNSLFEIEYLYCTAAYMKLE
jgi:hypothetical protein